MNACWNGTPDEYLELTRILGRNCECEHGPTPCAAHAITDEQRLLNGLVYGRRLADRFREEEWLIDARSRRFAQASRPAA